MSFLAQQLLWGAVAPAAITAVVVAVSWRAWRRDGVPSHWGTPVAIAAGYLFAHWRIVGAPTQFPPIDSTQWLFVATVALGLWGVVEHLLVTKSALLWVGRLVLAAVAGWVTLVPLIGNVWQGATGYLWWGGLVLVWWLWWSVQARVATAQSGVLVPLILSMVAGGGGFVLLWSNSSSLSQLSGAVAAVIGVMVPLVFWRREGNVGAGGIAAVAGLLGLLWINAIAFVPVPLVRILALMLASLSPLLVYTTPLRRKSPLMMVVLCALVTALVLTAVLLPTYRAYLTSATQYGY